MQIRDYNLGDEKQIIDLFELVFKQKMTLDHWLWRFRYNPAGKHLIKLMWDDDVLVGHYAVSPVRMKVNGEHVLTAHSLTTMTHPNYGGRGIFKKLSLALYHELENSKGCKAVWGFPNNNSHAGFVNSLGWSNIAVIHTLGIEANQISASKELVQIAEFEGFTPDNVDYINAHVKNDYGVYINKTLEYLNWRYVEKPSVEYKKFFIQKGDEKGIIVTKIYPTKKDGFFDLNIVECYLDNYNDLHSVIKNILDIYGLKFERITLWKSLFDKNHLKMERNGFVPVTPQTYLGARIHSSMDSSFADLKNWHLSMGDSDVF